MQGIFVQLSRLGLLVILWWLIFRVISTIRRDFIVEKKIQSRFDQLRLLKKSREPQIDNSNSQDFAHFLQANFLVITQGTMAGSKIPLHEESILIGRAANATVVIDDDYSSAQHAILTKSGVQWYVEDLGSTNGTFLNNSRVSSTMTVPLNTPIRVGKTIFELQP